MNVGKNHQDLFYFKFLSLLYRFILVINFFNSYRALVFLVHVDEFYLYIYISPLQNCLFYVIFQMSLSVLSREILVNLF